MLLIWRATDIIVYPSQLKFRSCAFMAPGLLAAAAFIFSMFGGVYCKFISHISTTDVGTEEPIRINSGIWYYQGYSVVNSTIQGTVVLETCNTYPEGTYVDARWKSARAFAAMALIIGGVVAFWGLLAQCIYPNKGMFQLGGMLLMLCCLVSFYLSTRLLLRLLDAANSFESNDDTVHQFQGLTFLFLESQACQNSNLIPFLESSTSLTFNDDCVMAAGGQCSIVATVLWFLAAVAAFKVDPPKRKPITTQTQDVTYTKTSNPDGTEVVTENVVKGTPVEAGAQAAVEVEAPQESS